MADIERDIGDFQASNRSFGSEWKLEMEGQNNGTSSNLPSSDRSSVPVPAVPQPVCLSTSSTPATIAIDIDKYRRSYYNYSKSNVTWGGAGDPELKRQRRMVKYNSFAVESRLKSGFRWMKNKCSEFVHGY